MSVRPGGDSFAAQSAALRSDVYFITGGLDSTINLWDVRSGFVKKCFQHPDSQVNVLALSPDKRSFAAGGFSRVRTYSLEGNTLVHTGNFDTNSQKNITTMGYSQSGTWMYTGGDDGFVRIVDVRTKAVGSRLNLHVPINAVVLHPDQDELYVGDEDGTVHICDVRNLSRNIAFEVETSAIMSLSIKHDRLAIATSRGILYTLLIDKSVDEIGERLSSSDSSAFDIHDRYILKIKYSPDGSLLATASADKTLKLWRADDVQLIATYQAPDQRWVWDCEFSNDGKYLFSCSSDSHARLWRVVENKYDYKSITKPLVDFSSKYPDKAVTALAYTEVP